MSFLKKIKQKAKANPKKIVFPEGSEERILRATAQIQKEKLANVILVGNPGEIKEKSKKLKLKIDFKKIEIFDPKNSQIKNDLAKELYQIRKNKGLSLSAAKKLIEEFNYFGTMLVKMGYADGMVTGTTYSTADSIRPALQIIKTKEKFHKVSGIYFILLKKRILLLADTAITIDPNSHDLVDIAMDTAETAKKFGLKPRVAMLSFSTKGSANHPAIDKVQEAVAIAKDQAPNLIIDGELQADAALVKSVAARKCPNSPIQGNANILIFPNLESANIGYKLIERLANAKAIGPILQGLKKPINDLSRGCSHTDIVNVTAFTVCECLP